MKKNNPYITEPRANAYLIGHKEAEDAFLNAWKSNKLHNSWLLCGEKGIGKATLAYKMARFLLSADEMKKETYQNIDVSDKSQVFQQIADCACYNLKSIERDYTEEDKKKIIKAIKAGEPLSDEGLQNLKKSAVIKIDEVRTINEFMFKTSYDDRWKIVIIDSVDDMNINSANALLKILEEPPTKSMLILISHNPNSLLATIKSRCNRVNLNPLTENEVASLLRRYRPETDETSVKKIAAMSEGSIGKAINYVDNDILGMNDKLCKVLSAGPRFKINDLLDFADAAVEDEQSYLMAKGVILKFLCEQVESGSLVEEMTEIWQNALKIFAETERINMDKKHGIINIVYQICKNMR